MQIKKHGNAIAITLAALAVVIAASGTAAAVVAATTVNIADPTVPSRIAHVNETGRLATYGVASTIDSAGLATVTSGDNFVTSPTTATLGITKISFSNPKVNSTASYAEVRFYLYKVGVQAGTCATTTATLLGIYNIAPGDDVEDVFPAPLTVKPTGSAPYCLDLYTQTLNGTYTGNWYPSYNLAAYVISGSYTGTGVNQAQVSPAELAKQEKISTSR